MTTNNKKCAHCKAPIEGYGHNGYPLTQEGTRVCDSCNTKVVLKRMEMMNND